MWSAGQEDGNHNPLSKCYIFPPKCVRPYFKRDAQLIRTICNLFHFLWPCLFCSNKELTNSEYEFYCDINSCFYVKVNSLFGFRKAPDCRETGIILCNMSSKWIVVHGCLLWENDLFVSLMFSARSTHLHTIMYACTCMFLFSNCQTRN